MHYNLMLCYQGLGRRGARGARASAVPSASRPTSRRRRSPAYRQLQPRRQQRAAADPRARAACRCAVAVRTRAMRRLACRRPIAVLRSGCRRALARGGRRPRARRPAVTFTDVTKAAGIRFRHNSGAFGKKYLPETMGSGAAFFDADGDGWQDILFVNSMTWPGRPASRSLLALYRNNRDGTFTDVTAGLGPRRRALRPWRRGRRLRQRRQDRPLHHRARKEPPVPQPWRPALRRRHRRGRCRQHRVLDQRRVARLRPRRPARPVRRQLRRLVDRERPVLHARRQVEVVLHARVVQRSEPDALSQRRQWHGSRT